MQIILSQQGTGKLLILRITQPVTETVVPPRPRQLAVQCTLNSNNINVHRIVATITDSGGSVRGGFTFFPGGSNGNTGVFYLTSWGEVDDSSDLARWKIVGFDENNQVHNLYLSSFYYTEAGYQSAGAYLEVATFSNPSNRASAEYDFMIQINAMS